jgi:hypothetical protein
MRTLSPFNFKRWLSSTALILILWCVGVSVWFGLVRSSDRYVCAVRDHLRGGGLFSVCQPKSDRPRHLIIVYEAAAIRFQVEARSQAPATRSDLPPELSSAMTNLHRQWCQQTPTFRALSENEPNYEIGIACRQSFATRIDVPPDQLPPAFAALFQQVPAP